MKFNKFIKEKRKICNLTQEKAADKIGVSVNTIQNWENESYTVPRMDIIPDIAKTYKVSVYDILRVIAADMEVQAERGKLNEIFPDEMNKLFLSEQEQDVLGYYYLKETGGKIYSFKSGSYETARAVNHLKQLNLLESCEKDCYITELGKFICGIIAEEPNQLFDICNCTPWDTLIIYHKYFSDTRSYILLNVFLMSDEYEIVNNQIQYDTIYHTHRMHINKIKEAFSDYIEICEKIIDGETKTYVRLNKKGKEIMKMIRG